MADVQIQQTPGGEPVDRGAGMSWAWVIVVLVLLALLAWFIFGRAGGGDATRDIDAKVDVNVPGAGTGGGGTGGGGTGGGGTGGGTGGAPKTP
jgi:hypothetical protein